MYIYYMFEDEFPILKTDKRIIKIQKKNWCKFLKEIIKKTDLQKKNLYEKDFKEMPDSYKKRYPGIFSVFIKMLHSSFDSNDRLAVNVKKELYELTAGDVFIFIKKMCFLHNLHDDFNFKYENVFFMFSFMIAGVIKKDKEVAKRFKIKI